MADHPTTSPAPIGLLVLYADVVGSTALYERFGDSAALASINACLGILGDLVDSGGGRVVKTIGDEILAVFPDPTRGVMAGADMPMLVRRASEEERFGTGELHLRVGMHFGSTIDEGHDVFGEGPITAQAVVKQAKADQVLTTRETVESLPVTLRASTRRITELAVQGLSGPLALFEVLWDHHDLTQVSEGIAELDLPVYTCLELTQADRVWRCNAHSPRLMMGRTGDNDIVIDSAVTSRQHAEVELKGNRFVLTDQSANGTRVVTAEGASYTVHREHSVLGASGRICLGGSLEDNPEAVLEFRCLQ